MQRRLLITVLAVAVAAVLALGIPLAVVLARLQADEFSQQVHRDAQTMANGLQERFNTGNPVDARQAAAALSDRYVVITKKGGGHSISVGVRPPAHDEVSATVSTASFIVTVASGNSVTATVTRDLLLIGAIAAAAVGLAVVLGLTYARRLMRPLEELAAAADRLGSGDSGAGAGQCSGGC
jgi:methyl-accepting chemotaxis protein